MDPQQIFYSIQITSVVDSEPEIFITARLWVRISWRTRLFIISNHHCQYTLPYTFLIYLMTALLLEAFLIKQYLRFVGTVEKKQNGPVLKNLWSFSQTETLISLNKACIAASSIGLVYFVSGISLNFSVLLRYKNLFPGRRLSGGAKNK